MKKLILAILVVIFTTISCKKSDPVVPVSSVKYMSSTTGSTWNYELVNNNAPVTTNLYTVTSTSNDSTINGKSYHVFTNNSGSGNEYFNITGNDYYSFRRLPAAVGGSNVENIYLKDNVAAGGSWNQSYDITLYGFPVNVTVTNTVTEKDISKTVNGITYTGVIHITTTLAVKISGSSLPAGALVTDIQSFYAKKVGMIQSNNKININYLTIVSNTDQVTTLKSADIK